MDILEYHIPQKKDKKKKTISDGYTIFQYTCQRIVKHQQIKVNLMNIITKIKKIHGL